jgi:hypothetical protein
MNAQIVAGIQPMSVIASSFLRTVSYRVFWKLASAFEASEFERQMWIRTSVG